MKSIKIMKCGSFIKELINNKFYFKSINISLYTTVILRDCFCFDPNATIMPFLEDIEDNIPRTTIIVSLRPKKKKK